MSLFGLFGPPNIEKLKAKGDVKGLIKALNYEKDTAVRQAAVEALGQVGDARAVEPLVVILKEVEGNLQKAVEQALGKIDPNWMKLEAAKRVVDPLVAAFKHADPNVHTAATQALIRLGPAAVEPLVVDLQKGGLIIQEKAVKALVKIGNAAVEPLMGALKDKDTRVWTGAREALGQINPNWMKSEVAKAAIPAFVAALKDKDDNVREGATWALGVIGDLEAVKPLVEVLKDKYSLEALEALGKIDPNWMKSEVAKAAIPAFVAALKDKDDNVRWKATLILRKIEDTRAVRSLIAFTTDNNRAQEAINLLNKLLDHTVADIATEDLREIVGLKKVFQSTEEYVLDEVCGGKNRYEWVDKEINCSQIKQLARQELVRRGLEA